MERLHVLICAGTGCTSSRSLEIVKKLEEVLPAYHLENEVERKRCEDMLHTCLEHMKEPDKSVFLYRYFYGYKVKDIGEMLLLSAKQVENILYRGKEKLRKELLERGIFHD